MAKIVPLKGLLQSETVLYDMRDIFFANAATQEFATEDDRVDYFDFWFRRYIHFFPEATFVAQPKEGAAIGYLVGSFVSNRPPLPGPDYYDAFAPALIEAYPAHIHVNVRADHQNRNIGTRLIETFRALCKASGVPGLHAVTAAASPAAAFFARAGLMPRATAEWQGRSLVFLAEDLA